MRNEKWDQFFNANKPTWDKLKQDELSKTNQKENDMNTPKVVTAVKEKVSSVINVGMQLASKPRTFGEGVAKTFNGVHDRKEQVKGLFKLSYAVLKDSIKEAKEGYTDTRYKKPEVIKPQEKTSI